MRSKTKYKVSDDKIIKLFEKAGIEGAENISPLGAGEYNSVYSVDAAGKGYAIKVAPHESAKILTYERQMMEQEIYYYSLMAAQAKISVPEIYCSDFSKTEIPSAYFIMERLKGKQIDQSEFSARQRKKVEQKLAAMVAKMHSVRGDKFGYRQNELYDNWYLALRSMVVNLIQDCEALAKRTKRGKKLLAFIDKNEQILEKVESSLINFDIWPPNIFCHATNGNLELVWIDPERCLWGDPIADFVCLDFTSMSIEEKSETVELYNKVSENPIAIGKEERTRFAIMLGYLGLIMEVEKYARYTIFHYGYWRNVSASRVLFSNCFRQLDELTD